MSAVIEQEVGFDVGDFFAPVATDMIDGLIGQYRAMRSRVEALQQAVTDEQYGGALYHFIEGNLKDQRHTMTPAVGKLFDLTGALAHLNATYWDKALKMTDVLDLMPQARRTQWYEQISNPLGVKALGSRGSSEWKVPPIPEFTEESVRATLGDLLMSRSKFFAERVDGIFRSLSRAHVTNTPQGFRKRMIIGGMISSFGTVNYGPCGVVNDLRCIIAKFMGREEPRFNATDPVIRAARRSNGEWMSIDGGALRIRVYNGVGTAHLEVHPDMAWRLNAVLASLYPAAIPAEFREKPARSRKTDFQLIDRPLPFAVVGLLAGMEQGRELNPDRDRGFRQNTFIHIPNSLEFRSHDWDKHVVAEAERVLASIGGIKVPGKRYFQFDYDPAPVIDQIVCSGCVPDYKSHQFYPTPETVAQAAIELADIGPEDDCLEPSAGTGGLADYMPKDRTLCVEVSKLHCVVLEAKGFRTACADFLSLAAGSQFSRIVMNPPFDQGRWQAHIEHAAKMLTPDGVLVAILPVSAKGKDVLPGMNCEWSQVFSNEFDGTGVSVVILRATKQATQKGDIK